MVIAITSIKEDLDSMVDPRFGRTKFFILYKVVEDSFVVLNNEVNLNAAQGAGIQTAQLLSDYEVDAVITGNVGPKAFKVLEASGIKQFLFKEGSVSDAIKAFKANQLTEVKSANVEGHWR